MLVSGRGSAGPGSSRRRPRLPVRAAGRPGAVA